MPPSTEAPAIVYCDLCTLATMHPVTVSTGHVFCLPCWDWRPREVENFLAQAGG